MTASKQKVELSRGNLRADPEVLVELFETLDGKASIGDLVDAQHDRAERLKLGRMLCLLESCDLARPA